jgi:hypothetical protein
MTFLDHPDAGTARDMGRSVIIPVRRFTVFGGDDHPYKAPARRNTRPVAVFGTEIDIYTRYASVLESLIAGPVARRVDDRSQSQDISAVRKKIAGLGKIVLTHRNGKPFYVMVGA